MSELRCGTYTPHYPHWAPQHWEEVRLFSVPQCYNVGHLQLSSQLLESPLCVSGAERRCTAQAHEYPQQPAFPLCSDMLEVFNKQDDKRTFIS